MLRLDSSRNATPRVPWLIAALALTASLTACPSAEVAPDAGTEPGGGGGGVVDGGSTDGGADPGSGSALCFEGWCWENPRPHLFQLDAVWSAGPNDAWVAGNAAGLLHWDGERFSNASIPEAARGSSIQALWGASSIDVWALTSKHLLHFDGTSWSIDDRLAENHGLRALWGAGPNAVWAVGAGRIVHFDGNAWTPQLTDFTLQLVAVSGSSANDVWTVSAAGSQVAHWDGAAWTVTTLGDGTGGSTDVWAGAPDDVWVVGDSRGLWHFDGEGWTQVANPAGVYPLMTVWGSARNEVWAGALHSQLYRFNGADWQPTIKFQAWRVTQIRGSGHNDVWVIGSDGLASHFDGASWTSPGRSAETLESNFLDVSVVRDQSGVAAFAVGPGRLGGDVVARRGADGIWRADTQAPRLDGARRIAASSGSDVWTVDHDNVYRFDGSSWEVLAKPTGVDSIVDLCSLGPTSVWALAQASGAGGGRILHWNGTTWTIDREFSEWFATDELLHTRLFCLSPEELWIGGPGLVLHRKNGAWQRQGMSFWNLVDRGESSPRTRVYVAGPEAIWAVRTRSSSSSLLGIARFDGQDWHEVRLPGDVRSEVFDVHGTSASDVWLATSAGAYHWNGTALAKVELGEETLRAVWAFAPNDALFITGNRTVVRWTGSATVVATGSTWGDKRSTWFASPSFGFLIDGGVWRWNGSAFVAETGLPDDFYPRAVWGFAENDVWLVGSYQQAAHWNGTDWEAVDLSGGSFSSESLIDVWGAAPDDVWALGSDGSVFHHTGQGFAPVTVEAFWGTPMSVRGSGASEVHFLGASAARWNGSSFVPTDVLDDPICIQKTASGLLAADVWGGVWKRTASGWSRLTPDARNPSNPFPTERFGAAGFLGDTEAYLLSMPFGGVWNFDGESVAQGSIMSWVTRMNDIQATDRELFITGQAGAVLRKGF